MGFPTSPGQPHPVLTDIPLLIKEREKRERFLSIA